MDIATLGTHKAGREVDVSPQKPRTEDIAERVYNWKSQKRMSKATATTTCVQWNTLLAHEHSHGNAYLGRNMATGKLHQKAARFITVSDLE